jgi:hypothetical protein
MRLCTTTGGIVTRRVAGRTTIKLTNGAMVKTDNADVKLGDRVLVSMNLRTGKVAHVWVQGVRTPDPIENQPPEEEHFGFYEED